MTTASLNNIRGLTFDVFGTCVEWREPVTEELHNACQHAVANPASRSQTALDKARAMTNHNWLALAEEWRASYYTFTRSNLQNPSGTTKTVDAHHYDALVSLLADRHLNGLFTEAEVDDLTHAWHRLASWPDTNAALAKLGEHYQTATLSNGNISLLTDMQSHTGMKFTHTFSGETFGTFKPDKRMYLGAVEKMGLKPEQVAMVAAHLGDLKAAKGCGLKTVFVERSQEDNHDFEKERSEGYVDLWIGIDDGGFGAIVKALGL